MGIVAAYAVPHPPLIVPAVGGGQERAVAATIASMEEVARRVAAHDPDLVIVVSPHAPAFRDGFFISQSPTEQGSMATFGQPRETLAIHIDQEFSQTVIQRLRQRGIPMVPAPPDAQALDHGAFVPLHFLAGTLDLDAMAVVRLGLSGLPAADHEAVGRALAATARDLNRRTVLVASGDWSHKLLPEGPYGFAPEGPQFDRMLADLFMEGDLQKLFSLDDDLCENAAECGLRSFQIMAGALHGDAFESELLSYEGPFGVGYGVAAFEVTPSADSSTQEVIAEAKATGSDPLVALARTTVESHVRTGRTPTPPQDFPREYLKREAGVFVSLHEHGRLRGCIGTIQATRDCIADEVIANAVSACSADPRFDAVTEDELDFLSYSVDVLSPAEPVSALTQLDPKHYGVIVTRGFRRGLLLPDLPSVSTVSEQLAIAKQKAGIGAAEDCKVERFEVIRHSAGGEARRD